MITDIAHGEVDLDILKACASLIPAGKVIKLPKVIKAIGNVGKTGFKKGKEGEKIVWKRFTREDKPKPDKNKGNQSKAGSKSGTTTSKPNQEEVSKSSQAKQTKAKNQGGSDNLIKKGKISIEDIKTSPSAFSGKSVDEIAQLLTDAGYDVTVQASKRSTSGAQIIKINNVGEGRNIIQVQVSPGGGRHGANPYVKISTNDQGIIKIVDGIQETYKTDGKETATIIFTGGRK